MAYLRKIKPGRVIEKWECEFRRELRQWRVNRSPEWQLIKDLEDKRQFELLEQQIIAGIEDGSIYGIAEVDIHTPDHLKAKFSEMTPIFKNTEISREDVGYNKVHQCFKSYYVRFKFFSSRTKFIDQRFKI